MIDALSSPIVCNGDNGTWQRNDSRIGGKLASRAIVNAYYPEANRGPGLLRRILAVVFSVDAANGVVQKFVLRKLTPKARSEMSDQRRTCDRFFATEMRRL
jgi:hypothetical protein